MGSWMSVIAWDLVATVIAITLWGISVWIPFRRIHARPEIGWDATALLCTVLFGKLVAGVLAGPSAWITQAAGVRFWYALLGSCPVWLLLMLNIVLGDLFSYGAHRLLHTRWFWPMHAWHHSPRYLYWAAGLRGSPVHVLLTLGPLTAATLVLPIPEQGIAATAAALFSIVNQHLLHSNIRLPWQKPLERFLVTPRYHFAHHSANARVGNTNFAFVFTCRDRWFGTFTDPETLPADDPLGIQGEETTFRMVIGWRKSQQ